MFIDGQSVSELANVGLRSVGASHGHLLDLLSLVAVLTEKH